MSSNEPKWDQVEALFDAVRDQPESEHETFIKAQTRDTHLAGEVRSLLDAVRRSENFLEPPGDASQDVPILTTGERLGAWRVEVLIAHGGMGEVYRVQRADGQYEQRAALKLMKPLPNEYRPLFDSERQFLARLEHPGIARLLDGGMSQDGRPWMVMEFASGAPADKWIREHSAGARRAVELALQAGDALSYAHHKLILHRDVKPSNILVDDAGRARVIDFGVARLADEDARRAPLSLEYAAPELIEGKPASTSSDVYGLAATLYALLTGSPPLELAADPLPVAVRRAVDEMPPPVSRRLPKSRRGLLIADLEAILGRALSKKPEDRYRSVETFCDDLRRALDGDIVSVRQTQRGYATGRFLRRHNWQAMAVAALLISLAGGLSASLWQARQANIERDWAMREQARLEAVQQYLYFMLRDGADVTGGTDASADEILKAAAEQVSTVFANDPGRGGPLMHTLGELYFYLNDYEAAAPILRQVVEAADVDPPVMARAQYDLAQVHLRMGDPEAAEPLLASSQAFWEAESDRWRRQLVDSRLVEARLLRDQGRMDEAVALLRESLPHRIALSGENDRDAGVHHNDLGVMLIRSGRLDEAAGPLRDALGVWREIGLEQSPDALNTLNNLAAVEALAGRHAEAAPLFKEILRIRRTLYGDSAATAAVLNNYGKMLLRLDRTNEALPHLEQAVEMALDHAGPASMTYASAVAGLTETLSKIGQAERSLQAARDGHARVAGAAGETSPAAAVTAIALARETAANGDMKTARALLDQAEATFQSLGPSAARQLDTVESVRKRFELDRALQ